MDAQEKKQMRLGLGVPSMVLVLLVLCLTLLGVLSLVSAHADERLSRRQKTLTQGYYAASAQAQAVLAALDGELTQALARCMTQAEYEAACAAITSAADTPLTWEDGTFSFEIDAQAQRALCVNVRVREMENASSARFDISAYALSDRMEWDEPRNLTLMDM